MKKGLIEKLFFASILLVFLSSGVFSLPYGTCNITLRGFCDSSQGNIIMGLSAATNAHGQAFPNTDYPYVVCCNFGTGNPGLTCITTPTSNKIIGLSSLTNAHAESPEQTNYQTVSVCYEDLQCKSSTNSCGTSDVLDYKLNFTSLSAITNAHIGAIGDYPIKICCKSAKYLSLCTLKSATWNTQNSIDGQRVYLTVVGSGPECDGDTVSFDIKGGYTPIDVNATSAAFSLNPVTGLWEATGSWFAEYQTPTLPLGGDPSFYFNATLVQNPTQSIVSSSSGPQLTVSKTQIIDYCADINSCSDYSTQDKCVADSSLCNVTKSSSLPGVDCSSHSVFCGCSWDTGTNPPTCGFSYSEIKSPLCENGTTLCQQSSTLINYCYPGTSCPSEATAPTNGDGVCNVVDSCASSDCTSGTQGVSQASCVTGDTCNNGVCYSPTATPKNATCNYHYTLCRVFSTNYCYPGNACPTGQYPLNNSNGGKCSIGSGCLSAECQEGNRDSCSNDTFCVFGMCDSALDPINLPTFGGGCHISQTVLKDCDVEPVGYKNISWTGTWTGTDKSGDAYNKCIAGGSSNVPCPAQVQLPFDLSIYGIAIALVIIALIYFFLIFRKKKSSKRRKKQKR